MGRKYSWWQLVGVTLEDPSSRTYPESVSAVLKGLKKEGGCGENEGKKGQTSNDVMPILMWLTTAIGLH